MDNLENFEMFDTEELLQDAELPKFLLLDDIKEFAPTSEIQAMEIRDVFLDMPELKFEEWRELASDEKVAALNALEQKVSDIAMRNPMKVQEEQTSENVMGYFDGKSLVISKQLLMDNSYEGYKQTLDTLFHEGRHAYQDYNLYVSQVEQSSEMVEAWRVNNDILGYDNGDRAIFKELGFYEYYTQPVEVDARIFAETVINTLGI